MKYITSDTEPWWPNGSMRLKIFAYQVKVRAGVSVQVDWLVEQMYHPAQDERLEEQDEAKDMLHEVMSE